MSYSHFFFVEEKHCLRLLDLINNKIDGQYLVLAKSNGYCDIAQYCEKFQNVKIITVKQNSLDYSKELV